jgi:hypothetical protein
MVSENTVLRTVWLACGVISRLFRLNSGMGWVPTHGKTWREPNGDVVVPGGRPVALGFGDPSGDPVQGVGDLVGWTTITITPEMVGCDVAVFTDIETKSSAEAKKRKAQADFIDLVKRSGGIAGFAHTPTMALEIVKQFAPVSRKA